MTRILSVGPYCLITKSTGNIVKVILIIYLIKAGRPRVFKGQLSHPEWDIFVICYI